MKLYDLIKNLEYEEIFGETEKEISSIAYDSLKVDDNSLFVAITGTKRDGHDYIPELVKKGIQTFICQYIPEELNNSNTTFIVVKDSRLALAILSDNWYNNPTKDMIIIGVTGTNGKTTITYILKQIFEMANRKVGVIGTTGIFIGNKEIPATHTTPESLELFEHFKQMRDCGIEIVIMEVSSHALHQNRVSSVKFNSALFTNLTHDHLDYHITFENYAEAKKKLFKMLPGDSIAVANHDYKFADYMLQNIEARTKATVGRKNENEFIINNEKLGLKMTTFDILFEENIFNIKTPLIGRFNVDNVANSFVLSYLHGIRPEIIINAISKCTGAPGRMQRVLLKNGAIGIVDYAHTPDALEKALSTCKELNSLNALNSKVFCVFGCGGDRDKTKRPKMGSIGVNYSDLTIITDDNPRTENPETIIQDIISEFTKSDFEKVRIISNRAEAIKFAVNISKDNDIILVAGKGHESYQIYGNEILQFDDVEELKRYC